MRFAKYHGIGNDFVMLADPADDVTLSPETVRALSDRRFGIGADGVIRVAPGSGGDDLFMDYVNSDGSIGEMCGNGIRCLALFARAEGMTEREVIRVGTRAGTKVVRVLDDGRVEVDMGAPIFRAQDVPVAWDGEDALHAKVELAEGVAEVAALSMGNPHAVLFVDDPDAAPVEDLGPAIERHPLFPNGTNVEFATVESEERVRMRVWERGVGETLACGTGACAVAVAARVLRGASDRVTVALPGGELEIAWSGRPGVDEPVFLTGPATKVFEGEIEL
ncbi:MAG TPA: diaminopimelate epimerase [Actinomycetota bacterium]|jgi:diaminopimelate epimerase|nr:diaminopimelate epimerase [Actinomycetota bacterium]